MKAHLLAILSVAALVPAYGQDTAPAINRLLDRIRAQLPKGWTASYNKEQEWLEVTRQEPVLSKSALPNGPLFEKPELRTFVFSLSIVPAVTPAEYRRLSAENVQIQKRVTAIYEDLLRKRVRQKFGSFSPNTEEEKKAVAEYEATKESLHSLPDFYFENISLEWWFNSPVHPIIFVTDERIRNECSEVRENVVKLLSKYEGSLSE